MFGNLTKAKKIVQEKLSKVKGKKSVKSLTLNPSLERLWDLLLEDKKKVFTQHTFKHYDRTWRVVFSSFFKGLHLDAIDQRKIKEFENWYLDNFPERNYFNTRKHLRVFLKFIKKQGYLLEEIELSNLDKVIDRNLKKEKVGRVYSEDEIERLMATAEPRARFVILVYSKVGLRKRELLDLKVSDFDSSRGKLKVWASKTGVYKIIPLPKFLRKEFKQFIKMYAGEEFLFESRGGGRVIPMRSQIFEKMWKEADKSKSDWMEKLYE